MRRIRAIAAVILALVVLAAASSGRTAAQAPEQLPAPTNLRIENVYNPLPPDLLTIPKVVRWDRVAMPGVNYRVTMTLPPRDGLAPNPLPETAIAKVADSEPPEYRFEYAPWRGPYCFRVAALYPEGQVSNSEPVCIAKQTDDSPFDVHDLSIDLQASLRGFVITWESHFYRGEYSVQKAVKPSSAEDPKEGDWGYASMHINEVSPGQYEFGDLGTVVGQVYCYRVRPNLEDGRWSPPACMGQPPVDFGPGYEPTPVSPDAGNGLPDALVHVSFPWELTVGGIVLVVVAVVNWLVFRGYR